MQCSSKTALLLLTCSVGIELVSTDLIAVKTSMLKNLKLNDNDAFNFQNSHNFLTVLIICPLVSATLLNHLFHYLMWFIAYSTWYTTGIVGSQSFVVGAVWCIARGLVVSLASSLWVPFVTEASPHICPTCTKTFLAKDYYKGRKGQLLWFSTPLATTEIQPFTVHAHCMVQVCRYQEHLQNSDTQDLPQTYSACADLNSYKELYCTPRVWEALGQSCWFDLIRRKNLEKLDYRTWQKECPLNAVSECEQGSLTHGLLYSVTQKEWH